MQIYLPGIAKKIQKLLILDQSKLNYLERVIIVKYGSVQVVIRFGAVELLLLLLLVRHKLELRLQHIHLRLQFGVLVLKLKFYQIKQKKKKKKRISRRQPQVSRIRARFWTLSRAGLFA